MTETSAEKTTAIAVQWTLTGLSVVIMMVRLIMRRKRLRKFDMGDYLTMAAIFALVARSSVETVALVYGTNQMHLKAGAKHHFTPEEISHRQLGAKMTMVNRALYTVYIWLQKCVVMSIIQHLLEGLYLYSILTVYWATMGVTFVASLVMGFVECHPFNKYWVVTPDPGTCAAGSLQLLVFSVLEIFTDLMLMVLPVRYLITIQRPLMAKLRLIALFLVGTAIVAVTLTRLLVNVLRYHRSDASHHIANVELLFATVVANSPVIYGMFNIKYRSSSQRYASGQSKPRSDAGQDGRQLDTFAARSPSALPKQQQVWSSRKMGETDSYEELIESEAGRLSVSRISQSAFPSPSMHG